MQMLQSRRGKICITPPKCLRKEIGRNYYSHCNIATAAGAMSWRRCVSLWKRKYFVWASKRTELEISGQVVFTTRFQNSSTQILECVLRILRWIISWTWKSSLQCWLHKGCFYKVGQFQLCKDTNTDIVMFTRHDATWCVKTQYESLQSVIMFPLDGTNASFIMGYIVFVSSSQDTASQYGKGA